MARLRAERKLRILGQREIAFSIDDHLRFDGDRVLPMHPNGMLFGAFDASGVSILERQYYSVGGGFVVGDSSGPDDLAVPTPRRARAAPVHHRRRAPRACAARAASPSAR